MRWLVAMAPLSRADSALCGEAAGSILVTVGHQLRGQRSAGLTWLVGRDELSNRDSAAVVGLDQARRGGAATPQPETLNVADRVRRPAALGSHPASRAGRPPHDVGGRMSRARNRDSPALLRS